MWLAGGHRTTGQKTLQCIVGDALGLIPRGAYMMASSVTPPAMPPATEEAATPATQSLPQLHMQQCRHCLKGWSKWAIAINSTTEPSPPTSWLYEGCCRPGECSTTQFCESWNCHSQRKRRNNGNNVQKKAKLKLAKINEKCTHVAVRTFPQSTEKH